MAETKNLLFEISWEVCNQVGGIYTVLKTKAAEVKNHFNDNYFCLGPLTDNPTEFIDLTELEEWSNIKDILDELDCSYKYGYWDIPGKPKVILISYDKHHHTNKLLHTYWDIYKLDTYHAGSDIVHPIIFSSLCAQFISAYKQEVELDKNIIAHAHEWMTGCCILHLNMHNVAVSTVFTTHATVTGRSFASHQKHLNFEESTASQIAQKYHVQMKHNIEKLSALQANCFTCVSDSLAKECKILHGKFPDITVKNGINTQYFKTLQKTKKQKQIFKKEFLKKLSSFFNQSFTKDTQLWISSGRYEIENKGFDTLITALDNLNSHIKKSNASPIIVIICPAVISEGTTHIDKTHETNGVLTTHSFLNIKDDILLQNIYHSHIHHDPERKVFFVYSPELLQGRDGFYNIDYYSLLSYMDLSIFPSLYEPWGYTPHESIACAVPTISSDTSGFGSWIKTMPINPNIGIITRSLDPHTTYVSLCNQLKHYYHFLKKNQKKEIDKSLSEITQKSDWQHFYKNYNKAYSFANNQAKLTLTNIKKEKKQNTAIVKNQPEKEINQNTKLYNDLFDKWFSNWWWSYNPEVINILKELNQNLYKKYKYNPLAYLEFVTNENLDHKLSDINFKKRLTDLDKHYKNQCKVVENKIPKDLRKEYPIAYLSMEFGIDPLLPIYSGGLGILAGDTLKSASDMHIPMIGFGLLYRMGYFTQKINKNGQQTAQSKYLCDEQLEKLKIRKLLSEKELIEVYIFNETVYLQCWKVDIGRNTLYLLDSDIIQNKTFNRSLTHKLYPTDRLQRLKQEVLLGYGAIKAMKLLDINPCLYHLNEGHCAFAIFERLIDLRKKKLPLLDCIDIIKGNTVFTTHTSVPAGLEKFDTNIVKEILSDTWEKAKVSANDCLNWGQIQNENLFSLTVLAFRFSNKYNGVSELHAKLANELWKNLNRVRINKIESITNGVHPGTWLGPEIRKVFKNINENKKIQIRCNLLDEELWQLHKKQKNVLLETIKEDIKNQYARRNESHKQLINTLNSLEENPEYLTIGFARRFATYKQADLILENLNWLTKILKKGVRIIFAGKAHPADIQGQSIIQKIYKTSKINEIEGHIILLENYNMKIAKELIQGVDLWLNNPIYGQEASGTSGMKAALNGVLNLSVKDGWWHEGYHKDLGFKIESQYSYPCQEDLKKDYSTHLYTVLEKQIIPCFYNRNKNNIPEEWVKKMKNSIEKHSKQYSSSRMIMEYYKKIYLPVINKNKTKNYQINYK